jgi:hypothetical protein
MHQVELHQVDQQVKLHQVDQQMDRPQVELHQVEQHQVKLHQVELREGLREGLDQRQLVVIQHVRHRHALLPFWVTLDALLCRASGNMHTPCGKQEAP